jgi:hypothetical protein
MEFNTSVVHRYIYLSHFAYQLSSASGTLQIYYMSAASRMVAPMIHLFYKRVVVTADRQMPTDKCQKNAQQWEMRAVWNIG